MKPFCSLFLFLLLATGGCAAQKLLPEPVDHIAINAFPSEASETLFFGPVEWYRNVKGVVSNTKAYYADRGNPYRGIIVITKEALLFLQWHSKEKRYAELFHTALDQMRYLELNKYGLNRKIVIRTKESNFHSFAIHLAFCRFFHP